MSSQNNASDFSDFTQTHWTLISLAGKSNEFEAQRAMEELCQKYWKPVYSYIYFHKRKAHEAEDLTQEFFTHMLEKDFLQSADREKGKFRSYLKVSIKNFLTMEHRKTTSQKRGGKKIKMSIDELKDMNQSLDELTDNVTSEQLFEARWAQSILDTVFERLEKEYEGKKEKHYARLQHFMFGKHAEDSYKKAAEDLDMTESSVNKAVQRLKKRLKEILRDEVKHTLNDERNLDEEIRYLISVAFT